jgi:hypothetical protein
VTEFAEPPGERLLQREQKRCRQDKKWSNRLEYVLGRPQQQKGADGASEKRRPYQQWDPAPAVRDVPAEPYDACEAAGPEGNRIGCICDYGRDT